MVLVSVADIISHDRLCSYLSREAFEKMHDYLHHDDNQNNVCSGRPKLMKSRDELGLVLFYLGCKISFASLLQVILYKLVLTFLGPSCPVFNLTSSPWYWGLQNLCGSRVPHSGDLLKTLVGPISWQSRENIEPKDTRAIIRRHNTYVSLRQPRMGYASLKRYYYSFVKSRLPSINISISLYWLLLYCCIILGHMLLLNQIATVLNLEYDAYVNVRNWWLYFTILRGWR